MTASALKELYNSPNGDRWVLCKDGDGKLLVAHHPNSASGGRPSEISVDVFLFQGGHGSAHQALIEAIALMARVDEGHVPQDLSAEAMENCHVLWGKQSLDVGVVFRKTSSTICSKQRSRRRKNSSGSSLPCTDMASTTVRLTRCRVA
jgi:hypothetical protein